MIAFYQASTHPADSQQPSKPPEPLNANSNDQETESVMNASTDNLHQWAGPIVPPDAADLADRYAIGQLCRTYALGVDMRDIELVKSVFDLTGSAEGSVGAFPLTEYLPKVYGGAAVFHATQHNITNQYITVDGNEAVLWSYGVAFHIEEPGSSKANLTVGVQYRDKCRRTEKGWLIYQRKAVMQWTDGPLPGAPKE
jgi:hypothetical protein